MKARLVAGKFATVAFASLVLAACTSTDTQEDTSAADAAAAEAAAAEAAAAERAAREAEEAARMAAMEEQKMLEDKAKMMGTVFYFAFDSSALTDEAREMIDAHLAALMGNNANVRLEGHTDERGTREYNLALGERRANSVRDYMVANGLPSYRIETISYGEENPVAFGSGESNWRQNRRVEIKY